MDIRASIQLDAIFYITGFLLDGTIFVLKIFKEEATKQVRDSGILEQLKTIESSIALKA